jgi:lipoyl-dependent peroxiredoxin
MGAKRTDETYVPDGLRRPQGEQGEIKLGSGAFTGSYFFHSRFEDGKGTNPEELIAAAHAGCISMALAATLAAAGRPPAKIHGEGVFRPCAGRLRDLSNRARDRRPSRRRRRKPRKNCPVSQALKAVEITITARLV